MKKIEGYVFKDKQKKKWCARISFTDETGKRKNIRRFFDFKPEAKDCLPGLVSKHKNHGSRSLTGEQMTVSDLIDEYISHHVKAPVMRNERKVSGLKSHATVETHCETLKAFFKSKVLRSVRPSDLEQFKEHRLNAPVIIKYKENGEEKTRERTQQRTIASVNRELEVLRAVFNFAKREGWIVTSPFEKSRAIIKKSQETKRFRVLSPDEEARLLTSCTGKREHLKAILIFLLDTGARRGEALGLMWRDVDFASREIAIHAPKTETTRKVPITSRLLTELGKLWDFSQRKPDGLVFGGIVDPKKSFAAACKAAGIEDFRIHDTRHSFISRLVRQGISLVEVMRLSGHSTLAAFNVYANQLNDTTARSADALNAFHQQNTATVVSEMVN